MSSNTAHHTEVLEEGRPASDLGRPDLLWYAGVKIASTRPCPCNLTPPHHSKSGLPKTSDGFLHVNASVVGARDSARAHIAEAEVSFLLFQST